MGRIDISASVVAGLGLATATVLFVGARDISPPIFDPVGSAALPRACAWALLGCAIGVMVQSFRTPPKDDDLDTMRIATLGSAILMVGYIAAMAAGLGFTYATILFVALSVPLIAGTWRAAPVAIALALAMGFGAQWLFTTVFFIDLPRFG